MSGVCAICSSPVTAAGEYCQHCGSNRSAESSPIAPIPIAGTKARKQSVSAPTAVMMKLFSKSQECSQSNLLALPLATSAKSSARGIFRSRSPGRKRDAAAPESGGADVSAALTALQAEVRALRDDLREETRARFKVETLLVRCVEDLMRLRGGVSITDDLLEARLRVATNFLDQLAPAWKLDYDHIDFGEQLAAGGFSDVYNGTYNGQKVAIKKLRIDVLNPDDYFLELEKEVQLMSELSHPSILKLVGVCVWPSYYILTEYMVGGTLAHALREPLNWATKQHVLLQIACALHYLHHLVPVVVHLDLKSLNVLMGERSATGWIAKLSDFGLSVRKQQVVTTTTVEKKFVGFRAVSAVSQSGHFPTFLPAMREPVGTPLHIAPELAKQLPFCEKADIFSFGMLMWETITQKRLHDVCGAVDPNVYTRFIPEIPASVPKELANTMHQCWLENQWERPSITTIMDLLNDFPETEWSKP